MVTIDLEKCIGCFKCVSACPVRVLDREGGKPVVRDKKFCMKCLHCAAACPEKAICLDGMEGVLPEEPLNLPENLPDIIEGYLMARRSYRNFKPEPVPDDIMRRALRVAAWAPSAKNQHPVKWIVVNGEAKIKMIMDYILEYVRETGILPEIAERYDRGRNMVTGSARTLLLAYSRTDAVNPPVDTALALYHVELALQTQGIGTCWAGYLTKMCNQVPALLELFHLPEGCRFFGSIMVGYPDRERYVHTPVRDDQPDVKWL